MVTAREDRLESVHLGGGHCRNRRFGESADQDVRFLEAAIARAVEQFFPAVVQQINHRGVVERIATRGNGVTRVTANSLRDADSVQPKTMDGSISDIGLRRVVAIVGLLNLGYFGLEFAVALAIGSVSLFADSIDFLEDASINFLIFAALGWSAARRSRVGMALAGILLIPGLATLWSAWNKFAAPVPPEAWALSLTGGGALAINLTCAFMLARYRGASGSLTRAAFLSARNDAFANVAIVAAGLATAFIWRSVWPDLIVGLGIAALNAGAAREVWMAAREEHRTAEKPEV